MLRHRVYRLKSKVSLLGLEQEGLLQRGADLDSPGGWADGRGHRAEAFPHRVLGLHHQRPGHGAQGGRP